MRGRVHNYAPYIRFGTCVLLMTLIVKEVLRTEQTWEEWSLSVRCWKQLFSKTLLFGTRRALSSGFSRSYFLSFIFHCLSLALADTMGTRTNATLDFGSSLHNSSIHLEHTPHGPRFTILESNIIHCPVLQCITLNFRSWLRLDFERFS